MHQQAGTLSGNPLARIAGFTLLTELKNNPSIYQELHEKGAQLNKRLQQGFDEKKIPVQINRTGSMISVHFSEQPVIDFATASTANNNLFKQYFHHMLRNGVYLPPSPFESWFLNNAISYDDVDLIIKANSTFSA